jgi:hypothetical protein
MILEEWVKIGIEHGFCGPIVCANHDGIPSSADEDLDSYNGEDPCVGILRIYESPEHRAAIEENHPPSAWRKEGKP